MARRGFFSIERFDRGKMPLLRFVPIAVHENVVGAASCRELALLFVDEAVLFSEFGWLVFCKYFWALNKAR